MLRGRKQSKSGAEYDTRDGTGVHKEKRRKNRRNGRRVRLGIRDKSGDSDGKKPTSGSDPGSGSGQHDPVSRLLGYGVSPGISLEMVSGDGSVAVAAIHLLDLHPFVGILLVHEPPSSQARLDHLRCRCVGVGGHCGNNPFGGYPLRRFDAVRIGGFADDPCGSAAAEGELEGRSCG